MVLNNPFNFIILMTTFTTSCWSANIIQSPCLLSKPIVNLESSDINYARTVTKLCISTYDQNVYSWYVKDG